MKPKNVNENVKNFSNLVSVKYFQVSKQNCNPISKLITAKTNKGLGCFFRLCFFSVLLSTALAFAIHG